MPTLRTLAAATLGAATLAAPSAARAQTFLGPTPYLSFADSPFGGLAFGAFYLETFEDGVLNTPGVSLVAPGASVPGPGPFTDSVDGDDGTIDGSGTGGRSLYSGFTTSTFTFDFDATALGGLPTHAGIVWTDVGSVLAGSIGVGSVTFAAFGAGLVPLGGIGPFVLGDGVFDGTTAEDRFLGVAYAGGIARIQITTSNSTDWEVDHLQYGLAATAVPEPATAALIVVPLAALGALATLASAARRRTRAGCARGVRPAR